MWHCPRESVISVRRLHVFILRVTAVALHVLYVPFGCKELAAKHAYLPVSFFSKAGNSRVDVPVIVAVFLVDVTLTSGLVSSSTSMAGDATLIHAGERAESWDARIIEVFSIPAWVGVVRITFILDTGSSSTEGLSSTYELSLY